MRKLLLLLGILALFGIQFANADTVEVRIINVVGSAAVGDTGGFSAQLLAATLLEASGTGTLLLLSRSRTRHPTRFWTWRTARLLLTRCPGARQATRSLSREWRTGTQ